MDKIHKFKGPDGKVHKVRGSSKEGALKFLQEHLSSQETEEGPKGTASGPLQTFVEQAAQGAGFDAYDTAKSKVTGESQEQVEADLQASHDANPLAGWAGYATGLVGGGGLVGMGVKAAGRALAPKAAGVIAKAAQAKPKTTAVATGAAAGLGYGTTHRLLNDREVTGTGAAFDALTGGIGGRIGHSLSKKVSGPVYKETSKEAFDAINESKARFEAKDFVDGFDKTYKAALKKHDVLDEDALSNVQEMRHLVKKIEEQGDFSAQNLVKLRKMISRGKDYEDRKVSKHLGNYLIRQSSKIKDPVVAPKGFRDSIEKGMRYTHKDKLADTIMSFAKPNKTFASRKELLKKPKFQNAYKLLDDDAKAAVDSWISQGFTSRVVEMLSRAGLIGTGTAIGHMFVNPATGIPQAGALLAAKPLNRSMQNKKMKLLEQRLRSGPREIQPIGPTPGLLGTGILGNFGE